jgi:hypothetical protein
VSNRHQEMQAVIRQYRDTTGEADVDMKTVAQFAVSLGWPLAPPADPIELLAREFSRAAREEIKYDDVTGQPYRVNHVFQPPSSQGKLWMDIDNASATREKMVKSLNVRREQMVGDGLQLSYDADHWNSVNHEQEPIQIQLDFTDDVEWRKNANLADEEEIAS